MIQLIPMALAKLLAEPHKDSPPRFDVGSFAAFVLSSGGECDVDHLTREESKIAHQAADLGYVRRRYGAWADGDVFRNL